MDFSESYRCSLQPCYSGDGRYIAAAVEYRLVIREVESLKVVQIYSCLDRINRIEWSASGKYILCGLYSRGIVQVWSVEDPDWTCKIDEGPAGIKHCRWSPDGLSLVLVADFCVRMTIWSLVDRKCTYLPGPKHASKGMAFSPKADQLAVLERKDCKDWLAIYSTSSSWDLQARVQLASVDAADLAWSPDSSRIAVWDSSLTFKVLIHAADGSSAGSYSGYEDGLGVRGVAWSPGGDLLAVGSYDQVVRVLNSVTWQPLLECHHGSPVDEPPEAAVYQEFEEPRGVLAPMQVQQQQPGKRETRARYLVCPLPVDVTNITPPTNKPNPKLGISSMAWSPNSQLLATVNENMPHAVWVWDVASAALTAVLLHINCVRSMAWSPAGDYLATSAGNARVYVWTVEGASIVHIPLSGFNAGSLTWSPDGTNFALMDQEAFCCAYVTS